MIKLSELKAARAAMNGGSLSIGWATGNNTKDAAMVALRDGVIATNNAADALIAIVECLLVRDAAAVAYARAFHASGKMEHADGPEYDAMGRAERALHDAHAALKAALAEVTL